MFEQVEAFMKELQDEICAGLGALDSKAFREVAWDRPGGGGGRSRVLQEGELFEKAGVNFSSVHGELPEELAKTMPGAGQAFRATGVSLVLHPRSPMIPTVHANFRFLAKEGAWWFGGGADLTPYYPFRDDVIHFHRTWRDVCRRHAPRIDYRKLKNWCDEYFFLPHRSEPRGVGGIFFDYLSGDFEPLFAFVKEAGRGFLPAYVPLAERRRAEPYGDRERRFQALRRGRYVEFNLLYDRGTIFGLKTGGRTESILMSLPPVVCWGYDYKSDPGSREAELWEYLRPRDWAEQKMAAES